MQGTEIIKNLPRYQKSRILKKAQEMKEAYSAYYQAKQNLIKSVSNLAKKSKKSKNKLACAAEKLYCIKWLNSIK